MTEGEERPEGQDQGEPQPTSDELLERLQYLQAEFENYRKRAEKEREELIRSSNTALVTELLPTLDAFEDALSSMDGEVKEGVAMVYDGLMKTLESAGLKEIPALDMTFDPYLHDVKGFTNGSDANEGCVAEIIQKGYTFHSRVLRPSRVVVVKGGGEDE